MRLRYVLLGAILIAVPSQVSAQGARWHWKSGQVHLYRVQQTSTITEKVEDNQIQTKTTLNLTKRWQVLAVDDQGIATLQMSLDALSMETVSSDGETLRFDSAQPDRSTPQLREQMARYVGKPLAVLRLGPLGQVIEVKESHFGDASRYENELPFVALLPANPIEPGQTYTRDYQLTSGEKMAARQRYTCARLSDRELVLSMVTELPTPPEAPADFIPWLQYLPEGEVTFDLQAGRLKRASLTIKKELKNHQGEASSYSLQGSYLEEVVEQ